jgi:zinc carboxypeptidase
MDFVAYAKELEKNYGSYRVESFPSRRFSPDTFHRIIDAFAVDSSALFNIRNVGQSFEERPLRLVSVGSGTTQVLLWSQMHGDESTATMAIADILNYLRVARAETVVRDLLSRFMIHFLPMLNPDGAARFQRRTAQGIDMNRDALSLQTPEAVLLKQLKDTIKPVFGFNLHDQQLSTVGTTRELAAVALLAPAFDPEKTDNEVRLRAKQVASVLAAILKPAGQNRITRYDDVFEPRAFGDNMQKWGTSTVLVESGHTLDDPEKDSIRKLNFIGILGSLYAIGSGEYAGWNTSHYDRLPVNGSKAYDLIIRNVQITHPDGRCTSADLGVSYQVDTHTESTPTLVDVGDLHTFVGLKEIDALQKQLPQTELNLGKPFEWTGRFG